MSPELLQESRLQDVYAAVLACMFSVAVLFFYAADSCAENRISAYLDSAVTYDDNIVFSYIDPQDDIIYEIFPGVDMQYRDDRNDLHLKASGHGQHYNTENDLDTFDVKLKLSADRQQTERLHLSLDGKYVRDTTLDEQFLETGQLLFRQARQQYSLSPEMQWNLNEKSFLSLSFPWVKTDYDGTGNVNSDTFFAYLTYATLLPDEKTRIFIQPDAGIMNFDTGDYRLFDCMLGVERDISERLYVKIMAGVNYTESKSQETFIVIPSDQHFVVKTTDRQDEYWGWVADAQLAWSWKTGRVKGNFSRRVSSSGYGVPVMNTRFSPSLSWRITERLTSRFYAGISKVESDSYYYSYDYYSYSAAPALIYRITPRISVALKYMYDYLDDLEGERSRDRNRIMVKLNFMDFLLD